MRKGQRVSFYLAAAAFVLAAVSLVLFFVTNATMSYAVVNGTWAIVATVAALAACGASAAMQVRGVGEYPITVLRLCAIGLMFVALSITLADRALVAGGLFTWNDLDTHAWNAFYTGIACMVFQILPVLLLIVSGFLPQGKKQ